MGKVVASTKNDIIFGYIYQPPENSNFFNADEAEMLDVEIPSMSIRYDMVYLFGDLNGHTACAEDFAISDHFIFDNLGIDSEELTQHCAKANLLHSLGLSKSRTSQDKKLQ